ncbi:MAG: 3-oxoacyl-ACP reductase FabG [Gammaproteobacteria bacterium]|nr:3-oxoacyl-ACP reductase FabG [Gammaproteobacteria bacterium]
MLAGEIALVTGATRGIGRAIAGELAAWGAHVVGTATSETGAERISEWLRAENLAGEGRVLDVTDPNSVNALIAALSEHPGAPTILVNNAGITRDNLLMRMKEKEWSDVIETNLTAIYRMTKACIRPMSKARHGRIINITSVVGVVGNAGQANYAAAKAGVIGLTKSLAKEFATRNVLVNAVAPGFIDTDMTRTLTEEQTRELMRDIPLDKLGQPRDVACAVAYLASPLANYVTGTTLHVNGGMHLNS